MAPEVLPEVPQSVVVTCAAFEQHLRGVAVHSWPDFLRAVENPTAGASLAGSFGHPVCATASICVINMAVWVLLGVLSQSIWVGLTLTLVYAAVLLASIRRLEASAQNRILVEFLWPGLPVVVFVLGLYGWRLVVGATKLGSHPRDHLLLVFLLAACPSCCLSAKLLAWRQSGPLVVNAVFGTWLAAVLLFAATAVDLQGELRHDAVTVDDFGACFLFVEGSACACLSLWLHAGNGQRLLSGASRKGLVAWLQGVASVAVLSASHVILRLPAWGLGGHDLARWCAYGILCATLMALGSRTGHVVPGATAAVGLCLILLRLALGATDVARAACGWSWEQNLMQLLGVFSSSLALGGFVTLHAFAN
eukprot:CAMPEP_0117558774 /NCGR_PEP_ID=MMETSP0784-20121206/53015_1 /TAXON_ID=39447 /ORGANISM="" /LENGTH=363 /DNA_ID=CAMNT_0005356125 /DNA_START=51 /DNA_END=1139 /DNA_ORIENTATION=+